MMEEKQAIIDKVLEKKRMIKEEKRRKKEQIRLDLARLSEAA